MNDRAQGNQLVPSNGSAPLAPITVGHSATIDLSFLSEAERSVLMRDYTKGMLDINRRAQELHVDVNTLRDTLDTLARTTKDVAESGNAVTATHTQTTSIGRTEIKMGNTEDARVGKISRTQAGERDWTPFYILAGIGALVLIAATVL